LQAITAALESFGDSGPSPAPAVGTIASIVARNSRIFHTVLSPDT
jgi:hypothetical protein